LTVGGEILVDQEKEIQMYEAWLMSGETEKLIEAYKSNQKHSPLEHLDD
jgi:hypothetical protein